MRRNKDTIDDWMKVSDADAFKATAYLWSQGYLVGTSSGLNYFAARKFAKENKGSTVVTLFPDTCLNSFKLMQDYIMGKSF